MSSEHGLKKGQIGYLQIPASDGSTLAEFYETVFGWEIERPYVSFESPGLIGNFDSERKPAPTDAGPLIWIHVKSVADTVILATTHGARIIKAPEPDSHGPRILATIADPQGNAVGIFEYGGSSK